MSPSGVTKRVVGVCEQLYVDRRATAARGGPGVFADLGLAVGSAINTRHTGGELPHVVG